MHVDWNWAKQRPHYIAQKLSQFHQLVVFYPFSWKREQLTTNEHNTINLFPLYQIPFSGKFPFLNQINILIYRSLSYLFLKWYSPDYIWITSPELYNYVSRNSKAKIIYDCMDDLLEFPANVPKKKWFKKIEQKLISVSNIVFCSSKYLQNKLISRYGFKEKYKLIYNAFEPSDLSLLPPEKHVKNTKDKYIICYYGTISSWLDIVALEKIVNRFETIEIFLLGPLENIAPDRFHHERIKYKGVVPHNELSKFVSLCDALIMPFVLSELIRSVDPVKLYEYIFFNKPIISVKYAEIEKFSPFVDFYETHEQLLEIVNKYLKNEFTIRYQTLQRDDYISNNNWDSRILSIQQYLK